MTVAQTEIRRVGASVAPLLALAVFINYVDRGNLGVAAPLLKDELRLSGTGLGVVISAFYWSYAPGQIISGWLAERVGPFRTLAAGLAIWSLATALTGLASSFALLLGLRVLLGVGESAAFPCASQIIASRLPDSRKGRANALIMTGTALGPAAGAWAGGLMMARWGWRPSFVVFGLISLVWLIPWGLAARGEARAPVAPEHPGRSPGMLEVAKRPELWGAVTGHLMFNLAFYFLISWMPLFLVKVRGLSMSGMAVMGAAIYLAYAASLTVMGRAADALVARGADAGLLHRRFLVGGFLMVAVSFGLAAMGNGAFALMGLFGAAAGFGALTPSNYTLGQILAGPKAGGVWMGLQNGLGNVGGIVGPIVVGVILDSRFGWDGAFAWASGMAVLGALSWIFIVRRVAPVEWGEAGT